VDSLSDFDRQRIEDLHKLMHEGLRDLYEINQKQAVEIRTLVRRQLDQDAAQVRKSYNQHREEYEDLLRKEIPTRFASGEQALIHTAVQRLNSDQLDVTRTALQEADRDPDTPEFAQLAAEVIAALPAVQHQLAAQNTSAAQHVVLLQEPPVI
jgi:hypothetical protein